MGIIAKSQLGDGSNTGTGVSENAEDSPIPQADNV